MTSWAVYTLYAAFVLGGVGLYFMLPQPSRSRPLAGGALALAGLAALVVVWAAGGMSQEPAGAAFTLLAVIAIVCTARVITHTQPVYCALYFVLVVLATAALCLLQRAEFLAVALVIIYAGAILVTYVFVIMLAQQGGPSASDRRSREPFLSVCAGFLTMAVIAVYAAEALPAAQRATGAADAAPPVRLAGAPQTGTTAAEGPDRPGSPRRVTGQTAAMGGAVMTRYMVVLQISGLLLLIAMVGAVAMSRKRVPQEGAAVLRPPLGQAGKEVQPF